MKKVLCILLLVTLAAAIATATPVPEGRQTLVFDSRLWSPPHEQEFVINEVLKPFGEENNCQVNFSIIDDDTLLKRAKLQKDTGNVTTDLVGVGGRRGVNDDRLRITLSRMG